MVRYRVLEIELGTGERVFMPQTRSFGLWWYYYVGISEHTVARARLSSMLKALQLIANKEHERLSSIGRCVRIHPVDAGALAQMLAEEKRTSNEKNAVARRRISGKI